MENDSKQYYVKLPLWKKCTFGMIDSANNFSWSYISSFLAIYLTDTFLIPAATVSDVPAVPLLGRDQRPDRRLSG